MKYCILPREHRRRGILLIILIVALFQNASCAMNFIEFEGEKGFYSYSPKDMVRLLESIGLPKGSDMPLHIEVSVKRNSDGSAVRIFSSNAKYAIALSCNGRVETINLPVRAENVWLDDNNNVIRFFRKGGFYNKNGIIEEEAKATLRIEFSGRYYAKLSGKTGGVGIFSIDRPDQPLIMLPTRGANTSMLFMKDNRLFLFDIDRRDGQYKAFILEPEGQRLIITEEIPIPKPAKFSSHYYALDLSPWKDEVIIVDTYDFPSIWPLTTTIYQFDLKTREFRSKGGYSNFCWYAECDIVKKFSDRKQ